MDDLISRADAIRIAEQGQVQGYEWQFKKLVLLPSAQKTGKWIKNDNGTWSCNRCHSWIPDEQHYYANFCLYCGCRMEEGDLE